LFIIFGFSTSSFYTRVFSASLIICSVTGGIFSSVVSFGFSSDWLVLFKVISKSPLETLSPILTFTLSTSPSEIEGTSTLDLSLSKVTIESFFFILSPFLLEFL